MGESLTKDLKCRFVPNSEGCKEKYCWKPLGETGEIASGFLSSVYRATLGAVVSTVLDIFSGGEDDKLCVSQNGYVAFNYIVLFSVVLVILALFGLVLMPGFEFFQTFITFATWVGSLVESGMSKFFSLYFWVWDGLKSFVEYFRELVGGNEIIFYLFGLELGLFGLLYVFLGFWQAGQRFMSTPIYEVYRWLNTPIRWIRINLLQDWFGVFLGNIISLFFAPIEVVIFFISLPIGGVIWFVRKIRDRSI